jgi:hypothetical protein
MSKYSTLQNTWKSEKIFNTERYLFLSYATQGPMTNVAYGLRAGLPIDTPMKNSPVKEPSPLNTRYIYNLPDVPINEIL